MKLIDIVREDLKNDFHRMVIENELKLMCLTEYPLNESNANDSNLVIQMIKNGEYETPQDPKSFHTSLMKSKHSLMLTHYSTSELSKMKLYKVVGYDIGFALKKMDGKFKEIVAVHNNEPELKNIGSELMKSAISLGGCYLDHFDGFLSDFYEKLGFIEIERSEYNPDYDEDGKFSSVYGKKDVIYRVHKNCSR